MIGSCNLMKNKIKGINNFVILPMVNIIFKPGFKIYQQLRNPKTLENIIIPNNIEVAIT